MNRQSDREFHALSEYIFPFSQRFLFGNERLEKLTNQMGSKSRLWKWDDQRIFVSLNFFANIFV